MRVGVGVWMGVPCVAGSGRGSQGHQFQFLVSAEQLCLGSARVLHRGHLCRGSPTGVTCRMQWT